MSVDDDSVLLYDISPDWSDRLLQESSSFLGIHPTEPIYANHLSPPFSRERPILQKVYRSDGTRPRDGGGLGSPVLVDPGLYQWTDPLEPLRLSMLEILTKSNLEDLCGQLAILSDWKTTLEDGDPTDSLPLGRGDWDPSTPLPGVRKLLLECQMAIQKEVDRLVELLLPCAATRCREAGWRFQTLIDKGQTFRLDLLAELAILCEDPDWHYVRECQQGLTLGDRTPLSDCIHFPQKEPNSKAEFVDHVAWSRNYRSAEDLQDQVTKMLQEHLDQDFVAGGYTWEELCHLLRLPKSTPAPDPDNPSAQLIPGVAVTRLGCVDESTYDANGNLLEEKYRLVYDGTISGVNGNCDLPVTAETPTLLDGESIFSFRPKEPFLGAKVDVKAAFQRLRLKKGEYAYALFSHAGKWYYSKTLPMGMRASPYLWIRFNSMLLRCSKRLLQCYTHASLMYVDDSLYAFLRSQFKTNLSITLLFLRLMGTPISWKKLEAGTKLNWVGYRLDFASLRAYLSNLRLEKIKSQMAAISDMNRVPTSEFRQLTFRMVWVSHIFPMSRVCLHEFFRALHSKPAQAGYLFKSNIQHLHPEFALWLELIHAAKVWPSAVRTIGPKTHPLVRTDACASDTGIYVGGWMSASIEAFCRGELQYFGYHLDASLFPEQKATPNRLISAAECVGVAIAVALWGPILLQSDSQVTVLGSKRWYSPSPNLTCALRLLVRASVRRKVRPVLTHVAGKDNILADDLSRAPVEFEAAKALAWLSPSARADSEVLFKVLPELRDYLIPHDYDIARGYRAWRLRCCGL